MSTNEEQQPKVRIDSIHYLSFLFKVNSLKYDSLPDGNYKLIKKHAITDNGHILKQKSIIRRINGKSSLTLVIKDLQNRHLKTYIYNVEN